MPYYLSAIRECEAQINKLNRVLRDAVEFRDQSELKRSEWIVAAREFREYTSDVDHLVDACISEGLTHDNKLREFAFDYLRADPYYFRSGYIVESLLQKIKKLQLRESEKQILRDLVLRRIDTKALRNFRHICRMIPLIQSDGFKAEVLSRTESDVSSVRYHAGFALEYFGHHSATKSPKPAS